MKNLLIFLLTCCSCTDVVEDPEMDSGGAYTDAEPAHPDACVPKTWYLDSDDDGYGVAGQEKRACKKPQWYAAKAGDCEPADPAVHPGVTSWHTTSIIGRDPKTELIYDYNCDYKEEKQHTKSCKTDHCGKYAPQPGNICYVPCKDGWEDQPPACGKRGMWVIGCEVKAGKCVSVYLAGGGLKTQACR